MCGGDVRFLKIHALDLYFTSEHAANEDLSHSAPVRLLNAVLFGVRRNEGYIGNHLGLGLAGIAGKKLVVPCDDIRTKAGAALCPGLRHANDDHFRRRVQTSCLRPYGCHSCDEIEKWQPTDRTSTRLNSSHANI